MKGKAKNLKWEPREKNNAKFYSVSERQNGNKTKKDFFLPA